ncbi:13590_t:CDS:2, partial [Funneliformis caledonium]
MQSIYDELSIEIFKCIPNPINLLVSSRKWHNISQDHHARAAWLIYKYGRAHALFHAVRIGNSFITVEVIQALLSKNVILSRYFVQRMLMHFGKYDENLIDRLELQKKLTSPWGIIRKESKSDIVSSCLIQAIKPERKFKKTDLLEFLIKRVDNPKEALKNALDHHKVGFKFNAKSIKTTKEIRSLSVNSNLYYWILKNYGPNSEVTQKCFDDIIESRIWVDLKLQETPDREVPEGLTIGAFNSICSIYLEFCEEKVPFKANILQYLQLINNYEIINPFFTYCIWYTINRGITFDD